MEIGKKPEIQPTEITDQPQNLGTITENLIIF